jgi:hypothetical protein
MSCIVDSAAIYIMVAKFRNTSWPPPPQLSLYRAALSSNSNRTRSVYSRENPKRSLYCEMSVILTYNFKCTNLDCSNALYSIRPRISYENSWYMRHAKLFKIQLVELLNVEFWRISHKAKVEAAHAYLSPPTAAWGTLWKLPNFVDIRPASWPSTNFNFRVLTEIAATENGDASSKGKWQHYQALERLKSWIPHRPLWATVLSMLQSWAMDAPENCVRRRRAVQGRVISFLGLPSRT